MAYKINNKLLKKKYFAFFIPLIFIFFIEFVSAHCPLCTAGAAAAAAGAVWLGVSKAIVALFIGAFAVSTALWVGRMIKKQYISHQKLVLIIASFLLTIIPILPIISQTYPAYISWLGNYGTLLNRTYIINISLLTSLLGGGIVSVSPFLSKKISRLRKGEMIPFQGTILTLSLLIITGLLIQIIIWANYNSIWLK